MSRIQNISQTDSPLMKISTYILSIWQILNICSNTGEKYATNWNAKKLKEQ